ncbi:hypothetical protein DL95DRAFT_461346 [Leptodontidium sp. 2 PMI_412]|nr:hypothetical protein DL95DRAFT_461346 [Leptodontidium sp. 2 PMI_412]
MEKINVIVIGAGLAGLVVLGGLEDEGFKVTVYKKRDSISGVWAYSDDSLTTSTLLTTVPNVSKLGNSFTDFLVLDVDNLWAKELTSVHGLRRFIGEAKVELTDGTILEVDTAILCISYEPDFSLTSDFSPLDSGKGKTADSLAFVNYIALADGTITISDLVAMALA